MPRQVRIEFAGATYHVMCRGDRREDIFMDDDDREMMLATLAETVGKTGWLVHAWVLMGNHYHLLVETPEPNLVKGMTWFQTTYTMRFNARHKLRGHLFAGRYKAVLVDKTDAVYFTTLLDYIHLNPVRAGLVRPRKGDDLRDYLWSSWRGVMHPRHRQWWQSTARAFKHWNEADTLAGRKKIRERLEKRMMAEAADKCGLAEVHGQSLQSALRRGWYYGTESFREWLLEKVSNALGGKTAKPKGYHGPEVREHGEREAQRLLREGIKDERLSETDLHTLPKGDVRKGRIANRLRTGTAVQLGWIAKHLHMGTPGNVAHVCRRIMKHEPKRK